jgi:hypothetical protein
LTAQENELPIISFVDSEVMHYKKVFDAEPNAPLWDKFPHMDQPKLTFAFVAEVLKAPTHNGLIDFSSASEVKQHLKQQIAHYVGDMLAGTIRPIKGDVSDILAEVKTLRKLISQAEGKKQAGSEIISGSDRYYTALRFLLDERQREYTKFMEVLFGDLDLAVIHIVDAQSLDQVLKGAGATIETVSEDFDFRNLIGNVPATGAPSQVRYMSKGQYGAFAILGGRRVQMTPMMREHLEQQQQALSAKLATKTKS